MAFTPVTFTPVEQRKFLVSEANGLRSRDEVWISIGETDLLSGSVLAGPVTLKAAADVSPDVYAQYNPSGVGGAETVAGVLLDGTRVDAYGVPVPHKASGRITFSAQPAAESTLVINGVTFTAKASGATGAQFNIGADLAAALTNLATALNASANALLTVATYSATATTLEIVYDTAGVAGNAFTVAVGSGTHNGAALAATLLGGGNLIRGVIINTAAEVKKSELAWFTGATTDQKNTGLAALRALGIKARLSSTEVTL